MMNILIIGGSGIIGSKMVKGFVDNKNNVHYTYNENKLDKGIGHKLDIRKKEDTVELISKINPDIVIHTAALTNIDLCETNKELANSINVIGTENVISGCKKNNSKIIYISTSFVFNGEKDKYFEDDKICPSTHYGLTKSKGEKIVKNSKLPYLIIRTDQPYSWKEKWQRNNSVLRVIQTLSEGQILNEITNWRNVPTYVPDLVNAIIKLINSNMSGIFHVCGSDFISRYEWSLTTAEIFGLNKNLIKPISSKDLNLPAKRVNVNLSNEKLFKKIGFKMNGIVKGLQMMKDMNSS
jgi:dTDP-4-dehydrorhamnose reductase